MAKRDQKPDPLPRTFGDLFGYVDELAKESDRAVVIMGAAYLDKALDEVIISFLIDDPKEVTPLFESGRALGSFGAKIRMAYCLGLLVRSEFLDLRIIQDIRNAFAHEFYGLTLGDESIAEKCANLSTAQSDPPMSYRPTEVANRNPRDYFIDTIMHLAAMLGARADTTQHRRVLEATRRPKLPRVEEYRYPGEA